MKRHYTRKLVLTCLLCSMIVIPACCFNIGCWARAKHERAEEVSGPMEPGMRLEAETRYGSVTVCGDEVAECSVRAEICARAPSEDEARELAEATKIKLETIGETVRVAADKPLLKHNRSISINYDITVPRQTSIECESSYGGIEVSDIEGDVRCETSYGSIVTENTRGKLELDTSYGGIICSQISSGQVSAKSGYGSIEIECSASCPADMSAEAKTSYGSIDFTAPANFAGEVEISTSYGSIRTELPVTVRGELSKKRIKGTVGQGQASVRLRTSYGSIKLR